MKFYPVWAVALILGVGSIALAAFTHDGAIIQNSGSTNTASYQIKVWSDGNAALLIPSRQPRAFTVPMKVVAKFFRNVKSARGNPGSPGHCMKSASFGTSTVVTWHGWRSFDLSCPGSGEQTELAANVRAITSASGLLSIPPRRIRLMPGELRRTPPAPKETPHLRLRQGT